MSRQIFPNEETFDRIYSECLENQPQATAIKDSCKHMNTYFEEYLDSVEEWMFRYAYQCGYEAALRESAKA